MKTSLDKVILASAICIIALIIYSKYDSAHSEVYMIASRIAGIVLFSLQTTSFIDTIFNCIVNRKYPNVSRPLA